MTIYLVDFRIQLSSRDEPAQFCVQKLGAHPKGAGHGPHHHRLVRFQELAVHFDPALPHQVASMPRHVPGIMDSEGYVMNDGISGDGISSGTTNAVTIETVAPIFRMTQYIVVMKKIKNYVCTFAHSFHNSPIFQHHRVERA